MSDKRSQYNMVSEETTDPQLQIEIKQAFNYSRVTYQDQFRQTFHNRQVAPNTYAVARGALTLEQWHHLIEVLGDVAVFHYNTSAYETVEGCGKIVDGVAAALNWKMDKDYFVISTHGGGWLWRTTQTSPTLKMKAIMRANDICADLEPVLIWMDIDTYYTVPHPVPAAPVTVTTAPLVMVGPAPVGIAVSQSIMGMHPGLSATTTMLSTTTHMVRPTPAVAYTAPALMETTSGTQGVRDVGEQGMPTDEPDASVSMVNDNGSSTADNNASLSLDDAFHGGSEGAAFVAVPTDEEVEESGGGRTCSPLQQDTGLEDTTFSYEPSIQSVLETAIRASGEQQRLTTTRPSTVKTDGDFLESLLEPHLVLASPTMEPKQERMNQAEGHVMSTHSPLHPTLTPPKPKRRSGRVVERETFDDAYVPVTKSWSEKSLAQDMSSRQSKVGGPQQDPWGLGEPNMTGLTVPMTSSTAAMSTQLSSTVKATGEIHGASMGPTCIHGVSVGDMGDGGNAVIDNDNSNGEAAEVVARTTVPLQKDIAELSRSLLVKLPLLTNECAKLRAELTALAKNDQKRKSRKKKKRCWQCGEHDHFRKDCPRRNRWDNSVPVGRGVAGDKTRVEEDEDCPVGRQAS